MQLNLKLTESCNFGCEFCRYANHRKADDGMSLDLVEKSLFEITSYNAKNKSLSSMVTFHGGEPLLYGIDRFNAVMEIENRLSREYGVSFRNCIQTNGALLNEEWCKFFKENDFHVGLSFDGPGDLNYHKSNRDFDFEASFVDAVKLLNSYDYNPGVISVITSKHIGHERELFDFFVNAGVHKLALSYCYNIEDDCSVDPIELADFLMKIYDIYYESSTDLHIRELDEINRLILGQKPLLCTMDKRCSCGTVLPITPDGDVVFCDDFNDKRIIGNIREQSLEEIISGETYRKYKEKSSLFIETACKNCEIYGFCGMGCSRADLNMERNYFCETYKIFYPYVRNKVNAILRERNVLSLYKLKRML